uniref:Uncharacterized protein n=1 Tax=Schistocephalus solidus TaxID=70667 RepID=A0A0X3PLP1_SCHSO
MPRHRYQVHPCLVEVEESSTNNQLLPAVAMTAGCGRWRLGNPQLSSSTRWSGERKGQVFQSLMSMTPRRMCSFRLLCLRNWTSIRSISSGFGNPISLNHFNP